MTRRSTSRRGLLGADQDHPEAAAALGDVEQDLLDRAPALARGVPVELVEDEEVQRLAAAHPLLVLEQPLDHTPVTNRFARSWRLWMSMTVTWFASQSIRWRAGSSAARAPDQVADPVDGPRRAGAGTPRPCPRPAGRASRASSSSSLARSRRTGPRTSSIRVARRDGPWPACSGSSSALPVEERLDPRDEVGDLRALVVAPRRTGTAGSARGRTRGPSSSRRSRPRSGPRRGGSRRRPAPGPTRPAHRPGRRPQPDRLERPGRQPEPLVLGARPRRRGARSAGRATAGPRP